MMKRMAGPALGATLLLATSLVWADDNRDVEGLIQSINAAERSFVVGGMTFHVTDSTRYEDGLKQFADLKVGQDVEVDYRTRDGRHLATEIEPDD